MRYAIEESEDMKTRMKIDDLIVFETIIEQIDASLSSLMSALQPAHLGSRTSSS